MLNLLQALIRRLKPQAIDPHVEQLLVRAVEQIDPRLKSFGNYPRAYRPAIATAVGYAKKLAEALPDCIALSPGDFAREPLLHALFRDVGAIHNTVCESQEIKRYCREHGKPEGGVLYALMGMRRYEKTVLGREVRGEVIQQDVQQAMVYFEAHTLTLPASSVEEFNANLQQHLFDSLIKSFSEQMAKMALLRSDLETERDVLVARLRSEVAQAEEMEHKLRAIRRQLEKMNSQYALVNYGELLNEHMYERQNYLRLERKEIPIDMRGVRRESTERLAGRFMFHDLVGRDRRRWTLYPVCLPVAEFFDAMQCSGDRERWIKI